MFYITDGTTYTAQRARFATFSAAADCAVKHAQQRGAALVSHWNGMLVADFRRSEDGRVTVAPAGQDGPALVSAWAEG